MRVNGDKVLIFGWPINDFNTFSAFSDFIFKNVLLAKILINTRVFAAYTNLSMQDLF